MWKAIKEMLGSKKALMAILSAAVWAGGKFGLELDADELLPLVAPLWAYVLGQSVADLGKEKAKIESGGA